MEMKLEIVSRETIKPLSPTPPDLKTYLLSSFDQPSNILFYMQFLFFYNKNSNFSSVVLKNSLSKTLVRYYTFAGRVSNDSVSAIDCNDEGVSFLEAKISNCDNIIITMSEIINNLKTKCDFCGICELLFSDNLKGKDQRFNPLFSVQITHFDCGGIAVAVFISHKIADMCTFVNFMNDWASIARSGNFYSVSPPRFDAAAFFPPNEEPWEFGVEKPKPGEEEDIGLLRFEIDGSKIARLKGIVGEKVENPSRVQVVTALVFKALANISKNQPASLVQSVNMRSRFVPSLPDNLTGNIVAALYGLSTDEEEEQIEVWKFVADMKKNLENFCNKYPRKCKKTEEWSSSIYKEYWKEFLNSISNPPNQKVYSTTSWCRFPVYETDFGWGKPIWVTAPIPGMFIKNQFFFMDTKDGEGIEVSLVLDTKDIAPFQTNIQHELLLILGI